MASYVAGQMGKSVKSDLTKEWSNAMHSVGIGRDKSSATDAGPAIDWADFNYPPCFRLFHYDPDELPSKVSLNCKFLHGVFLMHLVMCILLIVDDFVLAILGVGWFRFVYAILASLVLSTASGYIFYQGYVSLAKSEHKKMTAYLICQLVLAAFDGIFAFLPMGGFNGLAGFILKNKDEYKDVSDSAQTFWSAVIVYESLLWIGIALWGCFCAYRVKRFNPYHSQEAQATPGSRV